MARQVRCPICGTTLEWSEKSPFRPFCSERCKLTDLGAWASDAYRVAAQEESPSDADDSHGTPPTTH
ncbi:MAG: DNA gyrase inhibitor YacG [Burkholderiaceae bacterium]